jgi:hypothetical protein
MQSAVNEPLMVNVMMLGVVMLNDIRLSVVAPFGARIRVAEIHQESNISHTISK